MNEKNSNNYTPHNKLICDCIDKKNYPAHYRLLELFVIQGLVVDKIHLVVSFKPSESLEKYTSFNTQKRKEVAKDIGKDFYKLMKTAFYGKTMENVRRRRKIIPVEKK